MRYLAIVFYILFCFCISSSFAQIQSAILIKVIKDNANTSASPDEILNTVLSPKLEITPAEISFIEQKDSCPIGDRCYKTVMIKNTGKVSVKIENINLSNIADFSLSDDFCTGKTLGPQDSCTFNIYFRPTNNELVSSNLEIMTDYNSIDKEIEGLASDPYSCGGDGSLTNPFLICNVFQLQNMHQLIEKTNSSPVYVVLANDIDGSQIAQFTSLAEFSYSYKPISFNGNYHKIHDLNIYCNSNNCGIFSLLGNSEVYNLILENCKIDTNSSVGNVAFVAGGVGSTKFFDIQILNSEINAPSAQSVGALFGSTRFGTSFVKNVVFQGNIIGYSSVGGLIGSSSGPGLYVYNSYVHDSRIVGGHSYSVGGLVGSLHLSTGSGGIYTSEVINSSIEGTYYVGGITGSIYANSYTNATIQDCLFKGEISGIRDVGGIFGATILSENITIWNSVIVANIICTDDCGGLSGMFSGADISFRSVYFNGSISNIDFEDVYADFGSVINSYYGTYSIKYNQDLLGTAKARKAIPYSDSVMKMQSTYYGLDFINKWSIIEGESYPYLKMFPNPYE